MTSLIFSMPPGGVTIPPNQKVQLGGADVSATPKIRVVAFARIGNPSPNFVTTISLSGEAKEGNAAGKNDFSKWTLL